MKFLLIFLLLFLVSCKESDSTHNDHSHDGHDHSGHDHAAHSEENHEESHHHNSPYGGVLHTLEGHKASLACVADKDLLTLHIHDGCAEKDIRVAHEKLDVSIDIGDETKKLTLLPVESNLSGDKVGAASSFQIKQDGVKFEEIKKVYVSSITIQGIEYKDITIEMK